MDRRTALTHDARWIRERAATLVRRTLPDPPVVIRDTSDFTAIDYDHVVCAADRAFLIRGCLYESRFGIDANPKYWVKWAVDLDDGEEKILKFVFHEGFKMELGPVQVDCFRSPEKEARVLELVRGDPRFMQGETVLDERGNHLRVLDVIRGANLYDLLSDDPQPHESYFRRTFPDVLRKVHAALGAIADLHRAGECHGDIRNDHLLLDRQAGGILRWIDFDLGVSMPDADVYCAGNILLFAVGHGIVTFPGVQRSGPPAVAAALAPADAALFFPNRVANLRKVFPYVPRRLNDVLMRFSIDAPEPFETMAQLVEELGEALGDVPAGETPL